jgi:diguanylate cyclase (GGDEF)-like protein/PAS domain S-box-containing protein
LNLKICKIFGVWAYNSFDESDSPSVEECLMSDDRLRVGMPLLVFLLLLLAIVGVGYYVFQQQARHLKEGAQRELATIADLKAEQVANWRSERQGDAQATSHDYFLESAVAQWFQEGSPPGERRQRILDRLTALQRAYDYQDVVLLDDQGTLRLSTADASPAVSGTTRDLAIEAMRTGAILFSDLHRAEEEPGQPIRFDLLAPLLDENGQALGVLLFRIDPDRFLFPLIQSWPTPSASAETMLVERSGNDVLYLNELRHQKHAALAMRFPITEEPLASAIAARGQEQVFEGVDHRNVPVLAATRKIPGFPWIIIAKEDLKEVYAPIHERTLLTAELTVVLVALAGMLTALWLREKSSHMAAREYQSRLERQALIQHFDYLAKYANDIIFLYDSDFRIVEMNDRALAAYGYTREELLGLHISELRTPEAAVEFDRHRQQLEERGDLVYETQAMRKDKTVFPVEVSARMIVTEGRTFYQCIIRDITERKLAEEELQILQAQLREAAIRDPLTGLYNRRYLDETMKRELARAAREENPISIFIGDIDYFKQVNDTYGHQAGDEILKALGEVLREHARSGDIPCRYGGEEFVVILPDMPLEAARDRAELVRRDFADLRFAFGDAQLGVTISIGISVYPDYGTTADELIGAADQALYEAKQTGRNKVCLASFLGPTSY